MSGPGEIGFSFGLLTYNAHLFGDFGRMPSLPTYRDRLRAASIADALRQERAQGVAIVGLCEIWHPDMATLLQNESGFPYVAHGAFGPMPRPRAGDRLAAGLESAMARNRAVSPPTVLGCGLMLLSNYPLAGTWYRPYRVQEPPGASRYVSKGFLAAIVDPTPGPRLAVMLTHAQSPENRYGPERQRQMAELHGVVQAVSRNHPETAVMVMGDFNVIGEGDEYRQMMAQWGLQDAFRTAHPDAGDAPGFTWEPRNTLIARWKEETFQEHERLDYIFYTGTVSGFTISVKECGVRRYRVRWGDGVSAPTQEELVVEDAAQSRDGQGLEDLSDHYPLLAQLAFRPGKTGAVARDRRRLLDTRFQQPTIGPSRQPA